MADRGRLLNTMFRHTKHDHAMCLRPPAAKRQRIAAAAAEQETGRKPKCALPECRFCFPKMLVENSVVEVEVVGKDKYRVHVHIKRNDQLLNQGNRTQQDYWRANCDLQICFDPVSVTRYMLKYTTKAEKASIAGQQMMKTAMTGLDEVGCDYPGKRVCRKMLMALVGERDISTTESGHQLFSTPMTMSSEEFVVQSLQGDRKLDASEAGAKVEENMLDIYGARLSKKGLTLGERETLTKMNFQSFVANNKPMPKGGERTRDSATKVAPQ